MATASKNERLDLRLPADQKKTIKRTAALSGQTVSNFVLGTVIRRSRKVIREAETVVVSDRDRARLLSALDDADATPNAALKRAAARYKTAVG